MCISTLPGRVKKDQDKAIDRSRSGLSTKISATVEALGNPTAFHLTGGQACDLEGADILLHYITATTVLADKRYDADGRVLESLAKARKIAVIPSKSTWKNQRSYDKYLYEVSHLIEKFFTKLKQFGALAMRYEKTARNLAISRIKCNTVSCKVLQCQEPIFI